MVQIESLFKYPNYTLRIHYNNIKDFYTVDEQYYLHYIEDDELLVLRHDLDCLLDNCEELFGSIYKVNFDTDDMNRRLVINNYVLTITDHQDEIIYQEHAKHTDELGNYIQVDICSNNKVKELISRVLFRETTDIQTRIDKISFTEQRRVHLV